MTTTFKLTATIAAEKLPAVIEAIGSNARTMTVEMVAKAVPAPKANGAKPLNTYQKYLGLRKDGGLFDGQRRILDTMLVGVPMRVPQICARTGRGMNSITASLTTLVRHGYVNRVDKGVYTLTDKGLSGRSAHPPV